MNDEELKVDQVDAEMFESAAEKLYYFVLEDVKEQNARRLAAECKMGLPCHTMVFIDPPD